MTDLPSLMVLPLLQPDKAPFPVIECCCAESGGHSLLHLLDCVVAKY